MELSQDEQENNDSNDISNNDSLINGITIKNSVNYTTDATTTNNNNNSDSSSKSDSSSNSGSSRRTGSQSVSYSRSDGRSDSCSRSRSDGNSDGHSEIPSGSHTDSRTGSHTGGHTDSCTSGSRRTWSSQEGFGSASTPSFNDNLATNVFESAPTPRANGNISNSNGTFPWPENELPPSAVGAGHDANSSTVQDPGSLCLTWTKSDNDQLQDHSQDQSILSVPWTLTDTFSDNDDSKLSPDASKTSANNSKNPPNDTKLSLPEQGKPQKSTDSAENPWMLASVSGTEKSKVYAASSSLSDRKDAAPNDNPWCISPVVTESFENHVMSQSSRTNMSSTDQQHLAKSLAKLEDAKRSAVKILEIQPRDRGTETSSEENLPGFNNVSSNVSPHQSSEKLSVQSSQNASEGDTTTLAVSRKVLDSLNVSTSVETSVETSDSFAAKVGVMSPFDKLASEKDVDFAQLEAQATEALHIMEELAPRYQASLNDIEEPLRNIRESKDFSDGFQSAALARSLQPQQQPHRTTAAITSTAANITRRTTTNTETMTQQSSSAVPAMLTSNHPLSGMETTANARNDLSTSNSVCAKNPLNHFASESSTAINTLLGTVSATTVHHPLENLQAEKSQTAVTKSIEQTGYISEKKSISTMTQASAPIFSPVVAPDNASAFESTGTVPLYPQANVAVPLPAHEPTKPQNIESAVVIDPARTEDDASTSAPALEQVSQQTRSCISRHGLTIDVNLDVDNDQQGGRLWKAAMEEAEKNSNSPKSRETSRFAESLMERTRSRADPNAFVSRSPLSVNTQGKPPTMVKIGQNEDAFILSTTLAKKRVRVVQLLLIGLVGLLLGFLGNFFVSTSCHFASVRIPTGGRDRYFWFHFGLWKYSPIDSVFTGYSYCYKYDAQYIDLAPVFTRVTNVVALLAGAFSIGVVWLYLIFGRTKSQRWQMGVWVAVFAGLSQLSTLGFFWGSICTQYLCTIGPAGVLTILTSFVWFTLAYELHYHMPVAVEAETSLHPLTPPNTVDQPSSLVTTLEMSDLDDITREYISRVSTTPQSSRSRRGSRSKGRSPANSRSSRSNSRSRRRSLSRSCSPRVAKSVNSFSRHSRRYHHSRIPSHNSIGSYQPPSPAGTDV